MRLVALLVFVLSACSACEVEGPHTTYCLTVSGFTQEQADGIRVSAGQWIRAGYQQVSCDEPHDRQIRIEGAHLDGYRGRSLGQRVLIDYDVGECLRLTAVHEVGHSLAGDTGHAEPGSGVMSPSPGCAGWLLTDADVEWMLSR